MPVAVIVVGLRLRLGSGCHAPSQSCRTRALPSSVIFTLQKRRSFSLRMRVMRCFWPSESSARLVAGRPIPKLLRIAPASVAPPSLLQLEQKRQLAHGEKLVFHERLDGFLKLLNGHFRKTLPQEDGKYNIGREQLYCYFLSICCVTDPAAFWSRSSGLTRRHPYRHAAGKLIRVQGARSFYARLI